MSSLRGLSEGFFFFKKCSILPPLMATLNNSRVFAFSTGPSITTTKRVGTHNGTFHCDEALGCFLIRLSDKFAGAEIVRTRDPEVLDTLDVVLDVGGVYDSGRDRYDHHQRGFGEVLGHGFTAKLSSAGLVYKHYGKEIIAKELQLDEGHPNIHRVFLAVYKIFLEVVNFAHWKLHLFELEEEMRIDPPIKYVIYQDDRSKRWLVQAVAISPDRFESRKPLPSPWRGLSDEELSKQAGIPGCVFVHMSGFIGGNLTYEGALAMARASLKF
ncbi:MYG1 protein C694.04c-like [Macadamia integrifolia]|uniref:MYG1 protein C694.04c-like n=1 Tax=Macadamia integrifolia TaxID=60698 RepID=UPI001C4F2D45|nr:MYG1 protein C694.04c-like [Macadamia integrifolia]